MKNKQSREPFERIEPQYSPEVLAATGYIARHPEIRDAEYIVRYCECTGVVPDWLLARVRREQATQRDNPPELFHKYEVEHMGATYPTAAKSEQQAVNFIRFKLYGTTPANQLAPFTVRRVYETPTENHVSSSASRQLDVLSRLKRMGAA